MPPHCDSMDGPVVRAARTALDRNDVRLILPYVKKSDEADVRAAFDRVMNARDGVQAVNELADMYFFETVVRIHRAGEGAPYTGLKPAGLSEGPVVPVAERAIESGDPSGLLQLLSDKVEDEVRRRFRDVMARKPHAAASVESAREYVEAMLGLQVWSHHVYGSLESGAHAEPDGIHGHG